MAGGRTYYDFEHTQKISLRTYMKVIPSTVADVKDRTIWSEGAYRIGLLFTRNRLSTDQCFLDFGGIESQLFPTDLGVGVIAPQLILWLDGDVTTVRDDQIAARFVNGSANSSLIVLYDRIVWKKNDNFYPSQVADKNELAELIGKIGK